MKAINWFALAAGSLSIVLAAASLVVPWWQVTVGSLATLGWSPVKLSINVSGFSLAVPVLTVIGVIFTLFIVVPGIVLIIYSVFPTKPYAKHMLGFAYKKPLGVFILFLAVLLLLANSGTIAAALFHGSLGSALTTSGLPISSLPISSLPISSLNMPLWGTRTFSLSLSALGISIPISTSIQWTFWLAAVVAALCVAARIYHRKFVKAESAVEVKAQAPPDSTGERTEKSADELQGGITPENPSS
jgi:hypothetical protein